MQDVVKNATTELISGQNITGELTMKIKTLLQSCKVNNVNIVLFSYSHKPNYTVETTNIKIRSRNSFSEFIETYGESVVWEWKIVSENGIPCIIFDLENLVKE